jgi:hypothetical protein
VLFTGDLAATTARTHVGDAVPAKGRDKWYQSSRSSASWGVGRLFLNDVFVAASRQLGSLARVSSPSTTLGVDNRIFIIHRYPANIRLGGVIGGER